MAVVMILNGEMPVVILISFIMLLWVIYSGWIIMGQRRTIDSLTEKLMARSYVEYKSAQGIKEDDVSPVRDDDESLGWYDH